MIIRFALLVFAASLAMAADELVFAGVPTARIDSDGRMTKKAEFSASAACRIVKRGRRYEWASRENRPLDRVDAGDYIYYISPKGSGYIKVAVKPQGASGYDYMEHLSDGFTTVTYWGRKD